MSIRPTFRAMGDETLVSGFRDGVEADGFSSAVRRDSDEGETELDAGALDASPITQVLRGADLDALLNGVTGSEFLLGGWDGERPFTRVGEDLPRVADLEFAFDKGADTALVLPGVSRIVPDKDADIAQVLPGIMGDEFLLSKDVDLPLVLPGDDEEVGLLDSSGDAAALPSFPNHMLTLDPEGGFVGETDDLGRLHDHDGWLF